MCRQRRSIDSFAAQLRLRECGWISQLGPKPPKHISCRTEYLRGLEAQAALKEARVALLQAEVEKLKAQVDLETCGSLLETLGIERKEHSSPAEEGRGLSEKASLGSRIEEVS